LSVFCSFVNVHPYMSAWCGNQRALFISKPHKWTEHLLTMEVRASVCLLGACFFTFLSAGIPRGAMRGVPCISFGVPWAIFVCLAVYHEVKRAVYQLYLALFAVHHGLFVGIPQAAARCGPCISFGVPWAFFVCLAVYHENEARCIPAIPCLICGTPLSFCWYTTSCSARCTLH
jgi:hypothetical protein